MMTSSRSLKQLLRSCFSLVWIGGTAPWAHAADQSQLPDYVVKALERNASELSPLTITWERRRSARLPEDELLSTIKRTPEIDSGLMAPECVQYRWQHGMYYFHWSWLARPVEPRTGRPLIHEALVGYESESVFKDGVYYKGDPMRDSGIQHGDASLGVMPITNAIRDAPTSPLIRIDYFAHAGLKMPEKPGEHSAPRTDSLVLYSIRQGGRVTMLGPETVDASDCEVIQIESEDRKAKFYLDPALNFATRRRVEWSRSGVLAFTSGGSDFVDVSDTGVWLPKHIEVLWHTWETIPDAFLEEPLICETFDVTELDHTPIALEVFDLKNKPPYNTPGARIADATLPGAPEEPGGNISYRVPADPD